MVTPQKKHGPILVVDDHEEIRDSVGTFFRISGFKVETAANGAEALTKARDCLPCIVVLDLMMPVMSGFEFRQKQLEDANLRDIPVIVVTAAPPSAEQAAALRMADVLRKPIDLTRLLDDVRRYC